MGTVGTGEIHLIVGPMFSGKSTLLINKIKKKTKKGKEVVLLNPSKDIRHRKDLIVTHGGIIRPCYSVEKLKDLKKRIGDDKFQEIDIPGIDEGQFFIDMYEFCKETAGNESKMVIVAGLDGDFRRKKFGDILDLVPVADSVFKFLSVCKVCSAPATFTSRIINDKKTELIGGAESYCCLCRKHFLSTMNKGE